MDIDSLKAHILTNKFFLENNVEVEIPNYLKTSFRFPSSHIEKNLYKDKGHNFDLERFSIRYFKTKDEDYDYHLFYEREFYIDCSHFFLLFYENFPVAIIGFENRYKIVFIRQIQGINKSEGESEDNFHISFFYWQKVLVEYVEEYFRGVGFKESRILKAKENKWIGKKGKVNKKLLEQFKINYDKVARDMNYKGRFNPITTSFYKKL